MGSRKARPTVVAFLHRLAQIAILHIPKKGEYVVPADARVSTMPYVPPTFTWVTLPRRVVGQLFRAFQKFRDANTKLLKDNAELLKENARLIKENTELLERRKRIDDCVVIIG